MALGDFFRINMPYGMRKNDQNEWFVFNREYKPLGWHTHDHIKYEDLPVFVKYEALEEAILRRFPSPKGARPQRNEKGEIEMLWFYSDSTNPRDKPECWPDYLERIRFFSEFKVEEQFAVEALFGQT